MTDQTDDLARPPFPPFTEETAKEKIRAAENGWNRKDPQKVSLAYTSDSSWRNRNTFLKGRDEIVDFLTEKWDCEREYRLIKELWAFSNDRIAVRFVYEWRNAAGQWFRSHGNENWRFTPEGLMAERHASINDVEISEEERLFRWEGGVRPESHPGLSELGL